MKSVDAIILAGGMGTRLKSVISEIPKPMAPIGATPFLEYVIRTLKEQAVHNIVLSTGYKGEIIEDYFGNGDDHTTIQYSWEEQPLGTGGAIKAALTLTSSDLVIVLNGDTLFNIDIPSLVDFHLRKHADISIAMRKVENEDRYGAMHTDPEGEVITFAEKAPIEKGFINGGIYIMNREVFDGYKLPERFSLENDFFARYVSDLKIFGKPYDGYFIDIGIPEDYAKACRELPEMFQGQ